MVTSKYGKTFGAYTQLDTYATKTNNLAVTKFALF